MAIRFKSGIKTITEFHNQSPMVVLILLLSFTFLAAQAANSPVILLPGVGGSQLEVKLTGAKGGFLCRTNSEDFFQIWANPLYINGLLAPCLSNYLTQVFTDDNKSGNAKGVEVRVKEFDKVNSVERLTDGLSFVSALDYYKQLSDRLVSQANLIKDVTIRAAPYDWRKTLNELGDFYSQLQRQIEDAYSKGGNTSVVMVAHSMGCLVTMKFLQNRPQEWKDKYVASFVSVNGPYGGSVKTLLAVIQGYNLDIDLIPSAQLKEMQRTVLSTYLMLPSRLAFDVEHPLVVGPENVYTVSDLEEGKFFKGIGFTKGIDLQNLVAGDIDIDKPLGVKIHCMYGDGLPTINSLRFSSKDWPHKVTEMLYGGGDGTVNAESLKLCEKLKGGLESTQVHYFEGGKHKSMVKSSNFVDLIIDIVTNKISSKAKNYYFEPLSLEEES